MSIRVQEIVSPVQNLHLTIIYTIIYAIIAGARIYPVRTISQAVRKLSNNDMDTPERFIDVWKPLNNLRMPA